MSIKPPIKQCDFPEEEKSIQKLHIPWSQLKCAKHIILRKTSEACGVFYKDKFRLRLYIDTFGPKLKTIGHEKVGSCTHPKYTEIIWHTHPTSTLPYPSWQDITNILLSRKGWGILPLVSIIFTSLGIWAIHCAGTKGHIEVGIMEFCHCVIDQFSIDIYKNIVLQRKKHGKIKLEKNLASGIDLYCKNITKFFQGINPTFLLKFTGWKNVSKNGYIIG